MSIQIFLLFSQTSNPPRASSFSADDLFSCSMEEIKDSSVSRVTPPAVSSVCSYRRPSPLLPLYISSSPAHHTRHGSANSCLPCQFFLSTRSSSAQKYFVEVTRLSSHQWMWTEWYILLLGLSVRHRAFIFPGTFPFLSLEHGTCYDSVPTM